jgi:hypothetical protein
MPVHRIQTHIRGKRGASGWTGENDAFRSVEICLEQSIRAIVGPKNQIAYDIDCDPADVGSGREHLAAEKNGFQLGPIEVHALELVCSSVCPKHAPAPNVHGG